MREVKINGVYRHFKGRCYLVVDVAKHSETLEEYVVYRPLAMFLEEVNREKYPDCPQQYRFELVTDNV